MIKVMVSLRNIFFSSKMFFLWVGIMFYIYEMYFFYEIYEINWWSFDTSYLHRVIKAAIQKWQHNCKSKKSNIFATVKNTIPLIDIKMTNLSIALE